MGRKLLYDSVDLGYVFIIFGKQSSDFPPFFCKSASILVFSTRTPCDFRVWSQSYFVRNLYWRQLSGKQNENLPSINSVSFRPHTNQWYDDGQGVCIQSPQNALIVNVIQL